MTIKWDYERLHNITYAQLLFNENIKLILIYCTKIEA